MLSFTFAVALSILLGSTASDGLFGFFKRFFRFIDNVLSINIFKLC